MDSKRAIIVGASSGIGAEIAVELARRGYRLALLARRRDSLRAVAARCNETAGSEVATIHVHDVCETAQVPGLYRGLVDSLGGLDLIVYAAGIIEKVGPSEFDFAKDAPVVQIGLLGAMAWLNEAARNFEEQGKGKICAISSIAGDRGRCAYPSYHVAKAGLTTYLESLRNRLATKGVTVTTIKPGFVDTTMTKGMDGLFWVISPEKAAQTIVKHIENGAQTKYVPARWGLVAAVIKNIPSFVFRRMKI
ncbi:MAG: SDR family NAD(P)-dependent oxidoreductase [Planctomycetota bacterium]